jgi:hypothetical protein
VDTDGWELVTAGESSHPWYRMPDPSPKEGVIRVEFVNDLPWDYKVSLDNSLLKDIDSKEMSDKLVAELLDSAPISEKTFILESGTSETKFIGPHGTCFLFRSQTENFGYSAIDSMCCIEEGYTYRMTFVDIMDYASKYDVIPDRPMEKSTPGFELVTGFFALLLVFLNRGVNR